MPASGGKDENRVVVVGLGFVGQANAIVLVRMGYEVWGKDLRDVENIYATEDFAKIKIFKDTKELPFKPEDEVPVMVCVNALNQNQSQDLKPTIGALLDARKITKGLVILRTTLLPAHLTQLDFDIYLPEFLHERLALEEVQFPDLLVVGFKNEVSKKKMPKFIQDWHVHVKGNIAGKYFEGKPEECAYIKYLMNIWNATRIGFVNEYGDAILKEGITTNHEKIIDFVMERAFYLRYGKSFGGHCLPKDSEAFSVNHPDMKILKAIIDSNVEHKKFEQENANVRELFYGED
jgi:UDP-glucose 6-dehydrogenase